MVIKGTTTTGFKYKIEESALNNFELVDTLAELDDNPLLLPKVLKLILGDEQKKALLEHVRADDNTIPIELVEKELMDIIQGNQELKNS